MRLTLRNSHMVMLIVILLLALSASAFATGDVTFQVNMKIKMLKGTFLPGSGDVVSIAGDLNGWTPGVNFLTDPNNDSIYTGTITGVAEGGIQYKFVKTLRAGQDWENVSNRPYTVTAGAQSINTVYFDDDSVYTPPPPPSNVTFQVNMRVKMLEGSFRPDLGDIVTVPGSLNGWNTSTDTLTDPNNDSIYTKTITLEEGTHYFYKFYKTTRAGLDWENGGNKDYAPPPGGGTTPAHYFDDDSLVSVPINANILWQVDMTTYEDLGLFRPDLGDSVELRGSINGWGGATMQPNVFNPQIWEILTPYSGTSYDNLPFKFRLKLDSTNAEVRFPGYGGHQDDVAYEHPADLGDGNRNFNVGTGGNLTQALVNFSTIGPCGELLTATDSVTISVQVDMRPAMSALVTPFDPVSDTVYIRFQDWLTHLAQLHNQGTFAPSIKLTDGNNDSVYTGSVTLIGPAHYNLLYSYEYVRGAGGTVSEGGGLGADYKFRSRTVPTTPPHTFPRFYAFAQDSWQKDPPYPAEIPGCTPVSQTYHFSDGWNMVSVPLLVADFAKSAVFPPAQGNAFDFEGGGYQPKSTLANGPGYWLKFNGNQAVTMTGNWIDLDIPVTVGWNMIGSVSASTSVASVTTSAGTTICSNWFAYDAGFGYFVASTITPSASYWVKICGSDGTLTIPQAVPKRSATTSTDKLNRLIVRDAAGRQQILYFGLNKGVNSDMFVMPPAPPEGSFDARFSGDQMLALVDDGQSSKHGISISGATMPVTISWELRSNSVTASLKSGGKEVPLQGHGSITVNSGAAQLLLSGTAGVINLPKQYALSQNFPNPFNPTTAIEYQLPEDSKVTIRIYNMLGNEVKTLVDESQDAGFKSIQWNSTDHVGHTVATGVYFYRVQAVSTTNPSKTFTDVRKMVLMK